MSVILASVVSVQYEDTSFQTRILFFSRVPLISHRKKNCFMLHITYKDILIYSLKLASKFPMFGFSMLNSRTLSSKCTLMRVVCQTNVFPNFNSATSPCASDVTCIISYLNLACMAGGHEVRCSPLF